MTKTLTIAIALTCWLGVSGCGRQDAVSPPALVLRIESATYAGGQRVDLRSDGSATRQRWMGREPAQPARESGRVDTSTVSSLIGDLDRLGFFILDPGLIEAEVRSEQRRRGLIEAFHDAQSFSLLVIRDGRQHRVACAAIDQKAAAYPTIADLQRLHRCFQSTRSVTDAIVFTTAAP